MAAARDGGWDAPTRAFHWSLAALVVFSLTTGQLGGSWMPWHMRSGYAVLTLVLFRIAWGVVGPRGSRFVAFVRGPRAALGHARSLVRGTYEPVAGYTPLGGWMVVAFLAALALQAGTGLFSNDESSHEGPLAARVSNAAVDLASTVHGYGRWLVVALVVAHVSAIAAYRWRWDPGIVRSIVVGTPTEGSWTLRALALVAGAAAIVYLLVAWYPSR